jgi:uncharacterized protein (TIGR03435 family)
MITRTVFSILLCGTFAYGQTVDTHPSFDAASLKPASVGRSNHIRSGGPGTADPGRFSDSAVSLGDLLRLAYGLTRAQVAGPPWIETSQYSIAVTMPSETTVEQFHLMLQDLLSDRFHLVLHHQTRDVLVTTLEPAQGGTKVKKWLPTDERPDFPIVRRAMETTMPRGLTRDEKGFPILPTQFTFGYLWTNTPDWLVRVACRGCTIAEFVKNLERPPLKRFWFDPTIVDTDPGPMVADKTGIAGKLNFNLEFEELVAASVMGRPIIKVPSSGQPFGVAIEKQLGIRLVKGKKIPMDVLVVDHAEKTPAPN